MSRIDEVSFEESDWPLIRRRQLQIARNFLYSDAISPPAKAGFVGGAIRVVFSPEKDSEEIAEIAEEYRFMKIDRGIYEYPARCSVEDCNRIAGRTVQYCWKHAD